jgi:hypothetical protein
LRLLRIAKFQELERRWDTQFAAEEASRFTSKPEEQDWSSANRIASERVQVPEAPEKVVARSDTDFGGCRHTRRSTSGGVRMVGSHCVKT